MMPFKSKPNLSPIMKRVKTNVPIRQSVLIKSVQIMVFTPPLKVYVQIKPIIIATVSQNGMPNSFVTNSCNTIAAKYKRKPEPMERDRRKNAKLRAYSPS